MSFLKRLFGNESESDISAEIIKLLKCPCEIIPPTKDVELLWNKYLSAYERGKREGFTPVFIAAQENVLDMLESNIEEYNWNDIFSKGLIDAKLFLKKRLDDYFSDICEDDEISIEEIYGDFGNGEKNNCFSSWREYGFKKTYELIYAEIPTENPWEIFKWLPIGGWNDCPDAEDMMSVSKLWYEEYSAVPALITSDTLEYYLPVAIVDRDKAFEIAKQSFAFCQDIVDQGCGAIKVLADSITKSNVWYFWWD